MLRLEHVSKTFNAGTVNEKKALSDLCVTVEDGSFVTIVGSNGAGKSTLFNAISGVFLCDEGSIFLDDQDVTFLPEHKRARSIGRLFQDPLKGTAPHMSIKENLALAYLRADGRASLGRIKKAETELFKEKLASLNMGLEDRMDVPVGTLSGGQRQALTLLMATIVPPRLLLLDEHTAALDPAAAEKIMDLTQKIVCSQKTTCLMITHQLQQALTQGDRTWMMKDGRIVLDLSGEEKRSMTTEDLMQRFKDTVHETFEEDRILLSE